jgi:hypothetical protein
MLKSAGFSFYERWVTMPKCKPGTALPPAGSYYSTADIPLSLALGELRVASQIG